MSKLYMMCGIQGSGKSTTAREILLKVPNSKRVSRDDIREACGGFAH